MKKNIVLISVFAAMMLIGCSVTEKDLSGTSNVSGNSIDFEKTLSTVTSQQPVKLSFAKQRIVNLGSAYIAGVIQGEIEIANLAYSKNVEVHYSIDGGVWKTVICSYDRTLVNGIEIWKMNIDCFLMPNKAQLKSIACQFAIKYTVNGKTYWDNNNGANYKISTEGTNIQYPTEILGTSNVLLKSAEGIKNSWPAYANSLNYAVLVKNLAYSKKVSIVYTTDNWKTTYVTPLSYGSTTSSGNEIWLLSTLIALDVQNITFCVSYDVNGVTYWDNNGGLNYQLGIPGKL